MTERDDEAWRAIVENYGERATLDDARGDRSGDDGDDQDPGDNGHGAVDLAPDVAPDATPDATADADLDAEPENDPPHADQQADRRGEDPDATIARALAAEERFVPPPPPPLPYVAPPRLAAGLGVFGAPLVLLVSVVFGIDIPGWLGYLMVTAFVGGFAYLVLHMKKRPDDPWDDGARV